MGSYIEIKENSMLTNLVTLYDELKKNGDDSNGEKLIDLIEKLNGKELVIGFAGHFSAGKSTMINTLVGENILPSSPIPTSANVVKIRSGSPHIKVFYTNDNPIQFNGIMDIEHIKTLSKDGDNVQAIEFNKPITSLPEQIVIMDTPGIDSTNDADRIITEANIHVVDILFYMMDYNHVQSEVNLAFLKEMQAKGKPFYIIINQIDKHEEQELSFRTFQKSVHDALENWGIDPIRLFYTSLKAKLQPNNEINEIKRVFDSLAHEKDNRIEKTILHSATTIIKDHIQMQKDEQQESIDILTEEMEMLKNKLSTQDGTNLELSSDPIPFYKNALNTILKNAYLMPYENRELAKQFLESQQNQFKVGVLFAKKKTAQLKEERLNSFYKALMETTARQMENHIRDLFQQMAKKYSITEVQLLESLQSFNIEYDKERLIDIVKSGAEVTGNYVLVYTEEVVSDIKKEVKRQCEKCFKPLYVKIEAKIKDESNSQKTLLEQKEKLNDLENKLESIFKELECLEEKLFSILNEEETNLKSIEQVWKLLDKRDSTIQIMEKFVVLNNHQVNERKDTREKKLDRKLLQYSVDQTIQILGKTENLIKKIKGFSTLSDDLNKKKERLLHRHFTVALFGAFSAGKSSFANALLGDLVLPVSPNPTTATINKISPVTKEHPHGTVVIQFKSEVELLEDIKLIIKQSNSNSLENIIDELQTKNLSKQAKDIGAKNLSFLQAFIKGYDEVKENIGNQISLTLEEANAYIAEEKYACFVEWIEMFYDCAFTRNGITLVDTPGADSVNARHTDVAFEYIKDADAVLFVTYYNHAFSRADREFLLQLGRVKDILSLDKMFFIINASDLAIDQSELELVRSYVKNQLAQFSIHTPRLYSLSSKLAIQEKKNEDTKQKSGLDKFEQDFQSFIEDELTQLFIQSAFHDINRVKQTIDQYILSAQMNKIEKEKRKKRYISDQDQMNNLLQNYDTNRFLQSIEQETEELIFYIHQRIFLRFTEFFKDAFNPATIKMNGKKGKVELQNATRELLSFINHDLVQEIQATSLRIEAFMKQTIKNWVKEVESNAEIRLYSLTFSDEYDNQFNFPQIMKNLEEIDIRTFDKALRLFRNTKSFFESNEKIKMKDTFEEILKPIVKSILDEKNKELIDFFLPQWEREQQNVARKMIKVVNDYFDGLLYNLSDKVNLNELEHIQDEIKKLVSIN